MKQSLTVEHNTHAYVNRIVPMALGESNKVFAQCPGEGQSPPAQCSDFEEDGMLLHVGPLRPLPLLAHHSHRRLDLQGRVGQDSAARQVGLQQRHGLGLAVKLEGQMEGPVMDGPVPSFQTILGFAVNPHFEVKSS